MFIWEVIHGSLRKAVGAGDRAGWMPGQGMLMAGDRRGNLASVLPAGVRWGHPD